MIAASAHGQAQEPKNGADYSGAISVPGEFDDWTFNASQGDGITISIAKVFGAGTDSDFNPWIRLVGPNGTTIGNRTGPLTAYIKNGLNIEGLI